MPPRNGDDPPKMLVISRGNHPGVDLAMRRLTFEGSLRGWSHAVRRVADASAARDPWSPLERQIREQRIEHVVLHHFHQPGLPDPVPFIRAVRAQEHAPVVVFTGGDSFYNGFFRPAHPSVFRAASAEVDLVLNTSMGAAADAIVGYGASRVALFPTATCPVRFPTPQRPPRPSEAEFDVVFIGSNNRSRHPGHSYFWFARRRERLVRSLSRRFGARFAVFGRGWDGLPTAHGPIPFERQVEACRRARVVVGGVPYSAARYYLSNRVFIQALSGVPFVDLRVAGTEHLFRDGEHWHLVDRVDQVADRCDELLARPEHERVELGQAATAHIAAGHTTLHRWRGLLRTLNDLRAARREGRPAAPPDTSFFLPGTPDSERRRAVRGWEPSTDPSAT